MIRMKIFQLFTYSFVFLFLLTSQVYACTIDDSTTGVGDSSGEYIGLAREYCEVGDQVFMNLLHPWMVRYVVHGVCDMRFSVYVNNYVAENTDLKRANPEKWEERDSSVSCIYKGN